MDFSHGIKTEEIESDVDGALNGESRDEISDRAQDLPVQRLDSDYGKRGKIAKAKSKHVTDYGACNEVEHSGVILGISLLRIMAVLALWSPSLKR